MPRRALPSTSLSAAVRGRLGISREELGDLLGVSAAQVGHVECGRRSYSARAQARLRRLAELLPPAFAPLPDEPAPAGPTLGEATALRARLRACRHEARQLLAQQAAQPAQEAALRQRRQALAALRAALAAPAPTPADPAAEPVREQAWLELLELATIRQGRRQPSPRRGLCWRCACACSRKKPPPWRNCCNPPRAAPPPDGSCETTGRGRQARPKALVRIYPNRAGCRLFAGCPLVAKTWVVQRQADSRRKAGSPHECLFG